LEPAIETVDLTKRYGSMTAVNKLSLKVERGSVHGFLGPNGAGKTTTIKVLVGLLKPDGGSVKVLGQEAQGDRPETRERVGYMPELPRFPKHLKGYELLDVYGRMCGMAEGRRREEIPRLLEMVGLKGREKDLVGKYSKGMQQRIGIAQALLNEPELIILDEPSLGLDPVGMVEVRELMKGIAKQGTTVFLSSHLLSEVEQVCTDVTIINRGTMLASDTLQNVSGMLHGPSILQVGLESITPEVVRAVEALPFVKGVSQSINTLVISLDSKEDVRAQVSRAVTRAGGVIVAMSMKGHDLEEVFIQLISKSQEGGVA